MQATAPSCSCEGARRHSTKYVLKWHNEKVFMLVWVCAGQRDPCDMRWRLAYPCARARSSLPVAISRRGKSLPFCEALTLVYYGAFGVSSQMWLSQLKYGIQKHEVELRKTPKTTFLSIF